MGGNRHVMLNLITWSADNGYDSIDWNAITELSVFRMVPAKDGSIQYDGDAVDVKKVIGNAHDNGVKATVAVGGAGIFPNIVNGILSSQSSRAALVDSIANELEEKGYDGVQMDFENTSPGDFDKEQYATLVKELHDALNRLGKDYTISVTFARWEDKSIDPKLLEPYANHLLLMFDPSDNDIISYSSKLKDKSKLSIGYQLFEEKPAELSKKLSKNMGDGYGAFFWEASASSGGFYDAIKSALGK
ncbi:MAG: hypothetical protein KGI06_04840 [Candidatus Micrarchaeota archaeon]|nr:hypothetical protein [Candidatus Micrarchaeota archaeon]